MSVAKINQAKCRICNERLTDETSVARGIGPVCAANLTKFLAAVGSSAEEVAALALTDASAARLMRLAYRSLGDGRPQQAKFFFEQAKEAAAWAVALEEAAEAKAA